MTKINFRNQSAIKLDQEKLKLEASIITDLNRIFTNIANDASNIYKLTGTINSRQLAENYAPEILAEIRTAFRKSIKKFGFNLRKTVEKKHNLLFDAQRKATLLDFILANDLNIKQIIEVEDENLDEKLSQINTEFLVASTFFIANESEAQNEFVTDTNTKMIQNSIIAGLFLFSQQQAERQQEVNDLQSRFVTAEPRESATIARQIDRVNEQIATANNNRQAIVAENIRTNLLDKRQARSTIIAGQNIGLAEAWARQKEAELIDDANLISESGEVISVTKEWVTILDNVTRLTHVRADGQVVGVNEDFIVGNEKAQFPRSPELSAAESMNCRCISDFSV